MVQIQAEGDGRRVNERRREILLEASKCFREKGFHATGMRDVAARIGMTVGSLYYYFRNKEAILAYCQEETLGRLEALVAKVESASPRADGRLFLLIAGHVACLNEGAPGSLAHLEVPEGESSAALRERRAAYEHSLRRLIDDGVREGVFRPVDSRVAAMAILGAVNWTVRWFRSEGARSARDIGAEFAEHQVRGLLTEGAELQRPSLEEIPDYGESRG